MGGLSLSNKKNAHTILCGTKTNTSAHGMVDLTDPYVKNVIPALIRLGILKNDNTSNKDDDDLVFEEEDEVGDAIADALIIDMGKIINPNLSYKKVYHKVEGGKKEKCVYNGTEDYTAGMMLPSQEDTPINEDDENSTAKPKGRPQTVKLNQILDEDDDDDEEDEEEEEVEKVKFESKPKGKGHGRSNNFIDIDEI